MKRCRHSPNPLVWRTGGGDAMQWFTAASWESVDAIRCRLCGAWLSLGPSRDDGEHAEAVAIEIRAALLAHNGGPIKTCDNAMPDDCEECGWDSWPYMFPANDAEAAGYLARCIATHEEDSNG